jgi:hypothetical protein
MLYYKRLYLIGILGYGIALILAFIFYQERTEFGDIAFHLFEIISKGSLAIQNYRFAAAGTQIFPLIGYKASLPLTTIMQLYSCGFVLFYLLCYCICGFVLKQYRWGLILLFINTLFASHTFFWIQSELPQGLAILCVFFALSDAYPHQKWSLLLQLVLLCVLAFVHPIIPVVFFFILLFLWLSKHFTTRRTLTMSAIFSLFYVVKTFLFRSTYDHGSMGAIKNFRKLFPDYINLDSNYRFIHLTMTHYYWIPIAIIGISIWYFYQKNWHKLLLFLSAFFGYFLLIQVSFPNASTADCIRENLYLPLAAIIALPIVWDVFHTGRYKSLALGFTLLVVLTFCVRVLYTLPIYAERLQLLTSYVDTHRNEKIIAKPNAAGMAGQPLIWATPYESWLISTSRYNRTASIVLTDSIDFYNGMLSGKEMFISTWGYHKYSTLPPKYFILKDTINTYKVLR